MNKQYIQKYSSEGSIYRTVKGYIVEIKGKEYRGRTIDEALRKIVVRPKAKKKTSKK